MLLLNYLPTLKGFLIDPDKKICVFTFTDGDKQVVKCHEEDRFDWRIGLGVAISRRNKYNKNLQYLRIKLREKQYYLYCLNLFVGFDGTRLTKIVNEYENSYKEQVIQEKLRAYECELRGEHYTPKHITRQYKELY